VDNSMELPTQFSYLEPLTERVKREVMINNEYFWEMVDKQLDKEGISMMLNYQGEASFSG
jgi:hypothetical protein